MTGIFKTWLLITTAATVCATSAVAAEGSRFAHKDTLEPAAARWRSWIVPADQPLMVSAEPPNAAITKRELAELRRLTQVRSPEVDRVLERWKGGTCIAWNAFQRELTASQKVSPPLAARGYALVAVAMYDALVQAWRVKFHYLRPRPVDLDISLGPVPGLPAPSYVSERAAMSSAAATVLKYLHPEATAQIDARLSSAFQADLYSGACFRSDVEAGAVMGARVGALVVEWARTDGSDAAASAPYGKSPVRGRWVPVGPPGEVSDKLASPLLPGWGNVRTWLLPSGDAARPGPPPGIGSAEWTEQVAEVYRESKSAVPEHRDIARHWAAGVGTETPAGMWNAIGCALATESHLSEPRTARALAFLNTAQTDAYVACWDAKYAYDCCRPATAIRDAIDPSWNSLLENPMFPSYPSGHSTTSAAAAQILAYLFPKRAMDVMRWANEASSSRLYGGIHTRLEGEVGVSLGRIVGGLAIARAARDGTP